MLMLLSPAKTLTEGPAIADLPNTSPVMLSDSVTLATTMRRKSRKKLKEMMGISDNLAELNHARFQEFAVPFDTAGARQAARMFAGDVYRGLDAATLTEADLNFAQTHLVILSGLYGVLRPLDLMLPYRLEMGTSVKTRRGADLYAFWGSRISKQLNDWSEDGDAVVNLASQEYFKAVDLKKLKRPVITPVFKDVKDGKARTLGYFAKQARGAMVRWAVQNRVTDPKELKRCDAMDYAFLPEHSSDTKWVFQREQPPPVNG